MASRTEEREKGSTTSAVGFGENSFLCSLTETLHGVLDRLDCLVKHSLPLLLRLFGQSGDLVDYLSFELSTLNRPVMSLLRSESPRIFSSPYPFGSAEGSGLDGRKHSCTPLAGCGAQHLGDRSTCRQCWTCGVAYSQMWVACLVRAVCQGV